MIRMRAPDVVLTTTMAKANKPLASGRFGLLLLFLLLSAPHGANAEFGGGVLGFLRNLEFAVEKRTLWFYRFFGNNLHPSKLNLAKDCDYNDVEKIRFCPPALNPAMYGDVNPNLAVNPNVAATTASANLGDAAASEKSLPSKCLEDPDDPECRELRELQNGPPGPPPVAAPGTWVTDFPVGAISTAAPTKDLCFGNMAKNPKFCNSEMPSVSTEPSESPTLAGGNRGPGTDGLAFPSIGYGYGPGSDYLQFPSVSDQSDSPSDVPSEAPSGNGGTGYGPGSDGLQFPSLSDQSDSPSDVPSEAPSGNGGIGYGPGSDGLQFPSLSDQSDSPSDVPR